jgi:amino-acid N-acetyltransferase
MPDQGGYTIERARIDDVEKIHKLVQYFADRGEMLHRPLGEVYENIRDFQVARVQGEFAGCVALHVMWSDLAELKSLAVDPNVQTRGIGTALSRTVLDEAKAIGLKKVFCLTYRPTFFERLGFMQADVMSFPRKVWNECYRCPKFPSCNEIALQIDLVPAAVEAVA